jgi:hypothetical protein
VAVLALGAGTGLLALITGGSRAAMARTFTAGDTLCLVYCAFSRLQIVELHDVRF